MIKAIYFNVDLNKVGNGPTVATNIKEYEEIYKNSIIAEKAFDQDSDLVQTIADNCPKGYSLVDEVEPEYQVNNGEVYVPVHIEYGSVKNFKKDAFDIHDHEADEYFRTWLLCSFLADSLPFDVAARIESWFGKDN